jgi:NAD(P)-dependent dehydrogenase (short-subunit alcohol dehydrogenase family)
MPLRNHAVTLGLRRPDASVVTPRRSVFSGWVKGCVVTVLDKFRLDDRVVLITGASSGLGAAFAVGVAEAGADVVVAARRADRLQQTAEAVEARGRSSLAIPTDVSDPDACRSLVEAAVARFGCVDALVNNAGIGTAVPASRETVEEFRAVIDVNLSGCYWMAQSCGRVMQPGSSIVNVSSILAITTAGLPQAAYSASKAGLLGLTRDLAQQWGGRKGIRVNALAPGFYESEMTEQYSDDYWKQARARTVLGRPGDADDLAATLVWLISPAASYMIGQTIVVDGGVTLT